MDVDQIIKQVELNFHQNFVSKMRKLGLYEILKFCKPLFSTDFKKKQYCYEIVITYKIENKSISSLGDINEKKVLISNSYTGETVFRSSTPFFPFDQPIEVIKEIDLSFLTQLNLRVLEKNENWEAMFNIQTNEKL